MQDILTTVVGERCSVASSKVESTGFRVTDENGSTAVSLVEVQPFLSL